MRAAALLLLGACVIPVARDDVATTHRPAKNFSVSAEAIGNGWVIAAKNTSKKDGSIAWDQSTFVTRGGRAVGRLVRGSTRVMNAANAQPNDPIPSGTVFSEMVIPQQYIDETPATEQFRGRIVVVFDVGGERDVWVGDVHKRGSKPDDPEAPGPDRDQEPAIFYCSRSPSGSRYSLCERTRDSCEGKRRGANDSGTTPGDLGACEPAERAFCYDRGKVESCHPTPKACNDSRGAVSDATGDCSLRR